METRVALLGYGVLSDNDSSNCNFEGRSLMNDTHKQLLDKIINIQNDEVPCHSYDDTERYRQTLEDASILLEDEIKKLKSRAV